MARSLATSVFTKAQNANHEMPTRCHAKDQSREREPRMTFPILVMDAMVVLKTHQHCTGTSTESTSEGREAAPTALINHDSI